MMIIFIMLSYIDENSCLSTVGPFDNLVYELCVLKHLVYDLHSVLVIATLVDSPLSLKPSSLANCLASE